MVPRSVWIAEMSLQMSCATSTRRRAKLVWSLEPRETPNGTPSASAARRMRPWSDALSSEAPSVLPQQPTTSRLR
jgi:hypothetical protein